MCCKVKKALGNILDKREKKFRKRLSSIYHYTTIPGLIGILENKELWMSATQNLRDHLEMKHGKEMLMPLLLEEDIEPSFINQGNDFLDYASLICTSSFSENHDNTLMWKYYCNNFQGAVIEFNKELFSPGPTEDDLRVYFAKVMYCEAEAKEIFREMIQEYKKNSKECPCVAEEELRLEHITALFARLLIVLPQIKHSYFDNEKEYRLVYGQIRKSRESRYKFNSQHIRFPPERNDDYVLLKKIFYRHINKIYLDSDSYSGSKLFQLITQIEEETEFKDFEKIQLIKLDDDEKKKLKAPLIQIINK